MERYILLYRNTYLEDMYNLFIYKRHVYIQVGYRRGCFRLRVRYKQSKTGGDIEKW